MDNITNDVVVKEVKETGNDVPVKELVKEENVTLTPVVPQVNSGVPAVPTGNMMEALKVQMKYAQVLASSTMMPRQYQGNPGNCMIAIDMAERMNISPFMVAQNLDIIQGNPAWKSTAAIALINNCGRFEPLEYEFEHNEDWTEFSGYAYAKDIKSGKICKGTVVDKKMTVDMGWWDKNGSFWKKMPEQMLKYRTSVFFARTYCPEALMGLYSADEIRDINGKVADETVTVKVSK
jgi:hypothetical protein